MNPYLEHPQRWSTVHNRLIVALADVLTPQLLPKYQVDIEKRIYEVIGAALDKAGGSQTRTDRVSKRVKLIPNRTYYKSNTLRKFDANNTYKNIR